MFELLVATNPVRPSSLGSGVGALLVHAALVSGVVMARTAPPDRPPTRRVDTIPFVLPPKPTAPAPLPEVPPGPTAPDAPAPPFDLTPPSIPPIAIPPIDHAAPPLDPERIRGLIGSNPSPLGPMSPLAPAPSGRVVPAPEADEPVTPTFMPTPVYPPSLADAGVGGRVVARFVVDTTGRVEPETITILAAPHPALAASVREALARARFRPGRAHGAPVRVLVEVPVMFKRIGG